MEKLSVICTTYNTENFIEQCLKSILEQTFRDFELIIVDDGSTDKTPEICDRFACGDERVRVIHRKNGGSVAARAAGLKAASYSRVIFIDADDWIDPDMLEKMIRQMDDNDADVVVTAFIKEFPERQEPFENHAGSGTYKGEDLEKVLSTAFYTGTFYEPGIAPALWHKLFKKELIEKLVEETDSRVAMGDDACVTYPALLDAKCIVVDNSVKAYHYRITAASLSNKFDSRYFEKLYYLKETLLGRIKERKCKLFDEQFLLYISFLMDIGFKQYLNYSIEDKSAQIEYLENQFRRFPLTDNLDKKYFNDLPASLKEEFGFLENKNYSGLIDLIKSEKDKQDGFIKGLAKKKVMAASEKSAKTSDSASFEKMRAKLWQQGHYNFVRKTEIIRADAEKAILNSGKLKGVVEIKKGLYEYEYFNICFLNEMVSKSLDAVLEQKLPRVKILNSKGVNIWEMFFEQPYKNEKEDKLKVFEKSDIDSGIIARWDSVHSENEISALSKLYRQFAVFNKETQSYIDLEKENILFPAKNKGKVVGVLMRGTDYIKLKPKGHPVQPEIEDVIKEVDDLLSKGYGFVYLATEDGRIDKIFRDHYGDKLIINNRQYYDECYSNNELEFIKDVHFDRENDDYLKGLEYLSSLAIISDCDAFVGGNCGGTQAAMIFNGGKFDHCHVFNLGLY